MEGELAHIDVKAPSIARYGWHHLIPEDDGHIGRVRLHAVKGCRASWCIHAKPIAQLPYSKVTISVGGGNSHVLCPDTIDQHRGELEEDPLAATRNQVI